MLLFYFSVTIVTLYVCLSLNFNTTFVVIFDSVVVSVSARHAGDRGSIPRRGGFILMAIFGVFRLILIGNIKHSG